MNSLLKSHVFKLSFPVILPLFHPFFVWWANERAAGRGIERGTKNIITIILDSICFCFRTDTQKLERREQTLKEMLEFLPDIAVRAMGTERHKAGMTLLFELLQQPKLNKQVGCRYLVHLVAPLNQSSLVARTRKSKACNTSLLLLSLFSRILFQLIDK